MFLDEPTAGVDPLLRRSIWSRLRDLRDEGRTLLVTTQVISEAEYCDAVAVISEGRLVALAPPADLRRQALGGDVIQVETVEPFDPRQLARVAGVRDVRSRGLRELDIVVPDAGEATPLIIEAIEQAGGEVGATRQYQPSFDEVFTVLVEGHRKMLAAQPGAAVEAAA
jgi:ABC-2 type transport system ATP-binding protein